MQRWSAARIIESLRTSLWLVPALFVVGAIALTIVAQILDETVFREDAPDFIFQGGPEGGREVLSSVASSMMTFTGVVFSVTILVLQLASNQFSPRILREFMREPATKVCLGIFVGTFVYAMLTIRTVRGSSDDIEKFVPALSIWLAVVLAVLCVGTFIYFIHHVAQSIRAITVLVRIGEQGRKSLSRLYPEEVGAEAHDPGPRRPEGRAVRQVHFGDVSGVVISIDEERLWKAVEKSGSVVALTAMIGDFLPHGCVLFEVWGDAAKLDEEELRASVVVGPERTVEQDTGFAFRQMVDVAERALSPGINDPTTAVQAIDQMHDLLRRLVSRRFPNPYRLDDSGRLRLILPRPDWDSYLRLAIDEVRLSSARSMQVYRRLQYLIDDLLTVAPSFRRTELLRQQALLRGEAERAFPTEYDRTWAGRASAQGHGPGEHGPH